MTKLKKLQDFLKDSPQEVKLKQLLKRNGFVNYMTDRWQLDFNGKATIFVSRSDDTVSFSANFILNMGDGGINKGFIMCEERQIDNAQTGLIDIVEKLEEKYYAQ
jgi:hypothetical protein